MPIKKGSSNIGEEFSIILVEKYRSILNALPE